MAREDADARLRKIDKVDTVPSRVDACSLVSDRRTLVAMAISKKPPVPPSKPKKPEKPESSPDVLELSADDIAEDKPSTLMGVPMRPEVDLPAPDSQKDEKPAEPPALKTLIGVPALEPEAPKTKSEPPPKTKSEPPKKKREDSPSDPPPTPLAIQRSRAPAQNRGHSRPARQGFGP